jgi:hypothetical protein
MRDYRVVGVAVVAGAAGGVLSTIVTYFVARYGPQGDSWSFRGNGALVVPFGLGPAMLAAGWTAIAAHFRSRRRWPAFGLVAGAVGVVLAAGGAAALPVGGVAADRIVSPAVLALLLVWLFAAPLLAVRLATPARTENPRPGAYAGASLAFLVAMVLGFYGSELIVQV